MVGNRILDEVNFSKDPILPQELTQNNLKVKVIPARPKRNNLK